MRTIHLAPQYSFEQPRLGESVDEVYHRLGHPYVWMYWSKFMIHLDGRDYYDATWQPAWEFSRLVRDYSGSGDHNVFAHYATRRGPRERVRFLKRADVLFLQSLLVLDPDLFSHT